MGKRGPKPQNKIEIKWSSNFAYAIGLLASDGNVSRDGRRISFVSKDLDQVKNFLKALNISAHIGKSVSGLGKLAYRTQISDVYFCSFLDSIGIGPNKSKTIKKVAVPSEYFSDFLRGLFDGDGTIYSYWDKRWKSSFMFYTSFATASEDFVLWLRKSIAEQIGVLGHIKKDGKGSTYQLTYAKRDSTAILNKMYEKPSAIYLSRKKLKFEVILAIVHEQLSERMLIEQCASGEMADTHP